ncbi:MAG: DUF4398 domain-containing protein [Bdellovibrionia bacterium]
MRQLLIVLFSISLLSCQTTPPPVEEYALARAAIEAARVVQAPRHSPGHWHNAEESYRKARYHYREREYRLARDFFIKARVSAEKAENSARFIRQKTGDIL